MNEIQKNIFEKILEQNSQGVYTIDSHKPGKTIAIIACTHGNEPIGLSIFHWLIEMHNADNEIIHHGKILLIIANPQAARNNQRFIDDDMNRVWDQDNDEIYEVKRKKQLERYLQECDIVIDLHSTSNPSDSMIIPLSRNIQTQQLSDILDAKYILENIDKFTRWVSLTQHHASLNAENISIVIECGAHWDKKYENIAKQNIQRILSHFWYINFQTEKKLYTPEKYELFYVHKAQSLDLKYIYTQQPKSFDKIKKSEVICENPSPVTCPKEAYIIMPSKDVDHIWSEIFYLANKK